jgi:hypothetical protein
LRSHSHFKTGRIAMRKLRRFSIFWFALIAALLAGTIMEF